MSASLFRREIVEQQERRLMGAICLAQPRSLYYWFVALCLVFMLVCALLFFAEHYRKEKVRGYLVPDKGLLRVHAPATGIIHRIHVKVGDSVHTGDALVTLLNHRSTSDGAELGELHREHLQERLRLVRQTIDDNEKLLAEKLKSNEVLVASLTEKLRHAESLQKTAQERLGMQQKQLEAERLLLARGHISSARLNLAEERLLAEKMAAGQLEKDRLSLAYELQLASDHSLQLPLQMNMSISQLRRKAAELSQQLGEIRSSVETVLRATGSGTVTTVQVVQGERLTPGSAILSIIPARSFLIAELLLPTRSIGLIEVGHLTRLRFDAFPYQKFGLVNAEVLTIDRAVFMADNRAVLPQQEPVYRVRAVLDEQTIGDHALRPGMLLEADILLEKRRLIDWVLEPFLGFRGRNQ